MNEKELEVQMKQDIEEVFNIILKEYDYTLPIIANTRAGAEISDFFEDYFVEHLLKNNHPRIYNYQNAPKGKTKNPFDFCFNYKYKHFDDLIWGDIKASKCSFSHT